MQSHEHSFQDTKNLPRRTLTQISDSQILTQIVLFDSTSSVTYAAWWPGTDQYRHSGIWIKWRNNGLKFDVGRVHRWQANVSNKCGSRFQDAQRGIFFWHAISLTYVCITGISIILKSKFPMTATVHSGSRYEAFQQNPNFHTFPAAAGFNLGDGRKFEMVNESNRHYKQLLCNLSTVL